MTKDTQAKTGKFTPGPWVVVSGLPTLVNSGGMRQVGEPYRSIASTHVYKDKTTLIDEANARLIAKAPEMYELLERVDRAKNDMSDRKGTRIAWSNIVWEARRIKAEIDGGE